MKLIPNARSVMLRSHSMWALYLSVLCLCLPDAVYLLTGHDTNPRLWWGLGLALVIYGIVGRPVDQGLDRE